MCATRHVRALYQIPAMHSASIYSSTAQKRGRKKELNTLWAVGSWGCHERDVPCSAPACADQGGQQNNTE